MKVEDVSESEVSELKSWLFDRVGDSRDVVVDDLQDEEAPAMTKKDEEEGVVQGTEEYKKNVKEVLQKVAKLKERGCKEGRMSLSDSSSKAIHDGERKCYFKGELDSEGLPHGQGAIVYEDKSVFKGTFDHGAWNRTGFVSTEKEKIEGCWKDGLMEGEMRIEDKGLGSWLEGYWSRGVPHGFHREFGAKDPGARAGKGVGKDGRLVRFVGRCFRGVRRGFCWKGLFGGGFLCGFVDEEGSFSGKDIAYIYPDFKTVLRGEFKDEKLVDGKLCLLLGCRFEGGLPIPRFTRPLPNSANISYSFENPNKTSIGDNPSVQDPWEATRVEVRTSSLRQGGEGLFAKTALAAGEVVSLFNGVRIKTSTWWSDHAPPSDYRIRLNADIDLDIPHDRTSLSRYSATLAHKVSQLVLDV